MGVRGVEAVCEFCCCFGLAWGYVVLVWVVVVGRAPGGLDAWVGSNK